MKKVSLFACCTLITLMLIGCGAQRTFKEDVARSMRPAEVRFLFGTQPPNLKDKSKCTAGLTVNIVNVEAVNKDVNIVPGAVYSPSWLQNPRELTGYVINFLEENYRQCRVLANPQSRKTLNISIKKVEGIPNSAFKFNSTANLEINVFLPEKNQTTTFYASQSSGDLYWALVYAVHDISWQIINDPIIQDYILCM